MTFTLWCLDHLASRRLNTVFSCPEVSYGDKHPRCGVILLIQNIGIFVSCFWFYFFFMVIVYIISLKYLIVLSLFVFSTDFVALAGAGWGILH